MHREVNRRGAPAAVTGAEAQPARALPVGRQFNLDYLRAEIDEQPGRDRPGQILRQIDNPNAFEDAFMRSHDESLCAGAIRDAQFRRARF